jgi:HPt (histidine-containing phosphotransfer) domain-containing protein
MTGEDFIDELIDAFLDDTPDMISNMETALGNQDTDSLRRNAHSLKSNANTFGAVQLGLLAREIEFMARQNNLELGNRLQALKDAYQNAAEELRGMRP